MKNYNLSLRAGECSFEDSPFTLMDTRVVWDSELCQLFSGTVTRCPNGDLLTSFVRRTDAIVDNAAFLLRSRDNGNTWEKDPVIIETEREEGSAHLVQGMTTLKSGRILLPFADMSSGRISPDDHPRYMKMRRRYSDLKMMISDDSGRNWSKPRIISLGKKWEPANILYGRILELDNGDLIMSLFGPKGPLKPEDFNKFVLARGQGKSPDGSSGDEKYKWVPDPRQMTRTMLMASHDGGENWMEYSIIGEHPMISFTEISITCCRDGSLLALMRSTPDSGSWLWQARSSDNGATWKNFRPSGILGECMCLHRLPSNRLLAAYRKVGRLWDDERAGLGLSWSDDDGETWQGELTLKDPKGYHYKYSHEVGMPAIEDLGDGRFIVLFYSSDPDLPFDYRDEKTPEPWSELWYFWKRYIASSILIEQDMNDKK